MVEDGEKGSVMCKKGRNKKIIFYTACLEIIAERLISSFKIAIVLRLINNLY